jgi:hypothetical protein
VNCRLDARQCQENADFAAKLGLLHFVEERLGRKGERLCNLDDVQECDVPLATFDHPDVIAMQAGEFSQLLLRQAAGEPEAPKFVSKLNSRVGRHTSTFKGIAVWSYTL